jgi:hypothetical protein
MDYDIKINSLGDKLKEALEKKAEPKKKTENKCHAKNLK